MVLILLFRLAAPYRPDSNEFDGFLQRGILHFLKVLFGYYFLFELISVLIFILVAEQYIALFKMSHFIPTPQGILWYEIRFLPCILAAILIFGPITNGLRYLVFYFPDYSWSSYFPSYFLTVRMVGNYLIPFLIFGYIYLNINLVLTYNEWQKSRSEAQTAPDPATFFIKTIEAWDEQGETILSLHDVIYFEVESKNYYAYTKGRTYNIRKKLSELATELNPQQFFRINRSVIVNLGFIKEYTYWENDKYIVRLNDSKTEFIMQRSRTKELKERIEAINTLK